MFNPIVLIIVIVGSTLNLCDTLRADKRCNHDSLPRNNVDRTTIGLEYTSDFCLHLFSFQMPILFGLIK